MSGNNNAMLVADSNGNELDLISQSRLYFYVLGYPAFESFIKKRVAQEMQLKKAKEKDV